MATAAKAHTDAKINAVMAAALKVSNHDAVGGVIQVSCLSMFGASL